VLAVAGVVGLPDDVDDVVVLELQLIAPVQAGNADRVVVEHADDVALVDGDGLDPHAFAPVASAP
jgi:hypothetical protein